MLLARLLTVILPNKIVGEMNLQKVTSVSTFDSEDTKRYPFLVCSDPETCTAKTTSLGRFGSSTLSSSTWRLSTDSAEERFCWMEAIKPGSAPSSDFSKAAHEDSVDSPVVDIVGSEDSTAHNVNPASSDVDDSDEDPYEIMPGNELLENVQEEGLYDEVPPVTDSVQSGNASNKDDTDLYEDITLDPNSALHPDEVVDFDPEEYEDIGPLYLEDNTTQCATDKLISSLVPDLEHPPLASEEREKMEEIYEKLGRILGKNVSAEEPVAPTTITSSQQETIHQPRITSQATTSTNVTNENLNQSVALESEEYILPDPIQNSSPRTSQAPLSPMFIQEPEFPSNLTTPSALEEESRQSLNGSINTADTTNLDIPDLPAVSKNVEHSLEVDLAEPVTTPLRYENIYEEFEQQSSSKSTDPLATSSEEQKLKPPVPKPRTFPAGKPKPTNLTNVSVPRQDYDLQPQSHQTMNPLEMLNLVHSDDEDVDEDVYIPRPEWAKAATTVSFKEDDSLQNLQKEALFIPRSKVQNLELIGQGHYGQVYKAEYTKETTTGRKLTVAVKTIKKYQSQKAHDDFLKEMSIMSKFVHPNVIKLYGLVQQDSPWIILEFLEKGDLRTFLQKNYRPVSALINYMLDIAIGMHYIADKGLVHRDIAARNIILNSKEVCKISDFGLLREIPKDDSIYISQQACPVPVRWMAPESHLRREFSTATDIWSYGILMWELRYPSERPYSSFKDNLQCATQVTLGYRLNIPPNYPENVQKIMRACWLKDPAKRPSFLLISNIIQNEVTFQ